MTSDDDTPASSEDFEALVVERLSWLTPDLDAGAYAMAFNVIRLANRMVADLESEVHSEAGWSWAGFRILFAVLVHGELEPREISRLSDVTRASVSSVLNTLERDGLVVRLRESEDRRLVTVRLTELGSRKIVEAYAAHNARETKWSSVLTDDERQQLTSLVRKVLDGGPGSGAKLTTGTGQREWSGP